MKTETPEAPASRSRLWLWVVAAFLLQFAVWGTWLTIASKHKVAEVPLHAGPPR